MRSQGSPSPPHSPATPPAEPVPAAGPAPVPDNSTAFRPWEEVSNSRENPQTNRPPAGGIPPYPERNPGQHPLAATVFLPHFPYSLYSLYSPSAPYIHPDYDCPTHVYPPLQRAAEQTRPSSSAGPSGHPAQSRSSHTQRPPEDPPASKKAKIKPSRPERKEQRADQNPMPPTEDPPQGSSRSSQPPSIPNAVSVIVYHKENLPAPGGLPAPSPSGSGIVPPRQHFLPPINDGSDTASAPAPPSASGPSVLLANPATGMKRTQKRDHRSTRDAERRPLSSHDGEQASTSGASAQGARARAPLSSHDGQQASTSGASPQGLGPFSINLNDLTKEALENKRDRIDGEILEQMAEIKTMRRNGDDISEKIYKLNCTLTHFNTLRTLLIQRQKWNNNVLALKVIKCPNKMVPTPNKQDHKIANDRITRCFNSNALNLSDALKAYCRSEALLTSQVPGASSDPLNSEATTEKLKKIRTHQNTEIKNKNKKETEKEKEKEKEKARNMSVPPLDPEACQALLKIFIPFVKDNNDKLTNIDINLLKAKYINYFNGEGDSLSQSGEEQPGPSSSASADPSGHPVQSRSSHTQRGPEGPPAPKKKKINPNHPEKTEKRAGQPLIQFASKGASGSGSAPPPCSASSSGIVPPRCPPSSPINYGSGTASASASAHRPPPRASIVFSNPERRPLSSNDGEQASSSGASAQSSTASMPKGSFPLNKNGLCVSQLKIKRETMTEDIEIKIAKMQTWKYERQIEQGSTRYKYNSELRHFVSIYPLIQALNRWNSTLGALKICILGRAKYPNLTEPERKKAHSRIYQHFCTNANHLLSSIIEYSHSESLINQETPQEPSGSDRLSPEEETTQLINVRTYQKSRLKTATAKQVHEADEVDEPDEPDEVDEPDQANRHTDPSFTSEEFQALLAIFITFVNDLKKDLTKEDAEKLKTKYGEYFKKK